MYSSDEEEEEEDGDDRSGHDYEMATAHKAELELGSAMSSAFTSAPGKDVSDGVGDVQEKLKAETEVGDSESSFWKHMSQLTFFE